MEHYEAKIFNKRDHRNVEIAAAITKVLLAPVLWPIYLYCYYINNQDVTVNYEKER